MGKCKDCAWFPWKLGASLSGLPAVRCHPEQISKRFTDEGVEQETSCQYYKPEEAKNPKKEQGKPTGSEDQTPKSSKPPSSEQSVAVPEGEGDENESDTGTDNKTKKASK
jgi:hypothetical protein